MKLNTFAKGLLLAIITLVATTVTTTGFPTTTTGWAILGITTVGTTLVYLAKNVAWPSYSLLGTINIHDLISGLIMAVGTGLSSWAASAITSTPVNWHDLVELVLSIGGAYLAKNLFSHPTDEAKAAVTSGATGVISSAK